MSTAALLSDERIRRLRLIGDDLMSPNYPSYDRLEAIVAILPKLFGHIEAQAAEIKQAHKAGYGAGRKDGYEAGLANAARRLGGLAGETFL